MPGEQGGGITEKAGEDRADGICRLTGNLAAGGCAHVGNRPTANDRIERENQETRQNADGTDHLPDRV